MEGRKSNSLPRASGLPVVSLERKCKSAGFFFFVVACFCIFLAFPPSKSVCGK